jgi:CRP-like cAMP-binding protein
METTLRERVRVRAMHAHLLNPGTREAAIASQQPSNMFLESLSSESRDRLLSNAKLIALPTRTMMQPQGEFPRYAYFLTDGITSHVINLADGGTAEVCLTGREGFVDPMSLLGPSPPPTECFMQVAGAGYKLPFADLRKAFAELEDVRTRVLAVVQQQSLTTNQLAACNTLHDAEARMARWLLMVQDRVGGDQFHLTQEFLAQMLGTRRTTVALAAGALQRSGLIEYKRGEVTILARELLEDAACDCYPVVMIRSGLGYKPIPL